MPGGAEVRQGCFDSLTLFAKAKRVQSLSMTVAIMSGFRRH